MFICLLVDAEALRTMALSLFRAIPRGQAGAALGPELAFPAGGQGSRERRDSCSEALRPYSVVPRVTTSPTFVAREPTDSSRVNQAAHHKRDHPRNAHSANARAFQGRRRHIPSSLLSIVHDFTNSNIAIFALSKGNTFPFCFSFFLANATLESRVHQMVALTLFSFSQIVGILFFSLYSCFSHQMFLLTNFVVEIFRFF